MYEIVKTRRAYSETVSRTSKGQGGGHILRLTLVYTVHSTQKKDEIRTQAKGRRIHLFPLHLQPPSPPTGTGSDNFHIKYWFYSYAKPIVNITRMRTLNHFCKRMLTALQIIIHAYIEVYTGCAKKITIIFEFRGLRVSDCQAFFFNFVGILAPEVW